LANDSLQPRRAWRMKQTKIAGRTVHWRRPLKPRFSLP
jgi:hypothetical protein